VSAPLTGPEHFERAEALLAQAAASGDAVEATSFAAEATAHATLAVAAAVVAERTHWSPSAEQIPADGFTYAAYGWEAITRRTPTLDASASGNTEEK
jgi:hypothetical protein